MNMNPEKGLPRRMDQGAISITTIIITVLVIGVIIVVLRSFFGTVKEASTAVSDRNQKVIESRKALVTEQTERLKNIRDAQVAP